MLPRSKRISTQTFKDISKKGEVFHLPFFVVRCLDGHKTSRFSVVVSKKIANTAVLRNQIRRRVYSAIRDYLPQLSNNKTVVLMVKAEIIKIDMPNMKEEIKKIFVKCGLLK